MIGDSFIMLSNVEKVVIALELGGFESKWKMRFIEKWRPYSDDELRKMAEMHGLDYDDL